MTDTPKIKDRLNENLDSFVNVILVLGDMSLAAQSVGLSFIEKTIDDLVGNLMGIVMGTDIDPKELVRRFSDRALDMAGPIGDDEREHVTMARDMCIEIITKMQEDFRDSRGMQA